MRKAYTTNELESYLDEALAPEDMSAVEAALRDDDVLHGQLIAILQRRDTGVHSLGEIWRRNRVSCPSRETLGSYMLGVLEQGQAEFVKAHLEILGCRICRANWEDLERRQKEAAEAVDRRLKRYFQTSAGYLQPRDASV